MKKAILGISLLASLVFAKDSNTKTTEREIPVVKCSAPVYSIMVMEFDCKANSCENPGNPRLAYLYEALSGSGGVKGFGRGLSTMLTNALKATNCFKIVELEQYERIQKLLTATGQKVKPPKVDYTIMGSITALELERSGGALGGGLIPIIGAIGVKKDIAKLGVDVSVIKSETLEVVASQSFDASSDRTSWGLFGAGWGGGGAVGGGWSVSKNLSLDMVARDVVIQIANSLAEKLVPDKIVQRPAPPKKEETKEEKRESQSE